MKKIVFGLMLFLISISVSAKSLDEIYAEIAPNDVFTLNAYKPDLAGEEKESIEGRLEFYTNQFLRMNYPGANIGMMLVDCNDDLSVCDLDMSSDEGNLKKQVSVVWSEKDENILKEVNKVIDIIKKNADYSDNELGFSNYVIDDSEAVDYLTTTLDEDTVNANILNYIGKLKNLINNSHITLGFETRLGDYDEFYSYGGGNLFVLYDDVMCESLGFGLAVKNVIYVPEYTEDSPEAFIAAARRRLGNKIGISKVDLRENFDSDWLEEDYDFSKLADESKMNKYYFKVTNNNKSELFVIARSNKVDDPIFDEVAPNGVLSMKAYKPDNYDEDMFSKYAYYQTMTDDIEDDFYEGFSFVNCNDELSKCVISVEYNGKQMEKEVSMKWVTSDNTIVGKVTDALAGLKENAKKIENSVYYYDLLDEDLVNFPRIESTEQTSTPIHFVQSTTAIDSVIKKAGLTYDFVLSVYGGDLFEEVASGGLLLTYKGNIVGFVNIQMDIIHVFYVPDDAKDDDAIIKAIKDRLNDENVKVEVVGKRSDLNKDENKIDFSKLGDESKMADNYYQIGFIDGYDGFVNEDFVIIRDSSKLDLEVVAEDKKAHIKVIIPTGNDSPEVELVVVNITSSHSQYGQIKKALKTENFKAFDINVNSKKDGKPITKLANGDFKITVPLGKEFIGKKVVACYIREDGTIERYNVVVDSEGNGTFETPHLSTYVFALEDEIEALADTKEDNSNSEPTKTVVVDEEVPKTFDSVYTYVALLMVSIISFGLTIYFKKKYN